MFTKSHKKLYILLLKKVNFVKVLLDIICNCFRNHCSHMVLRDPGRNSFFLFFTKRFDQLDRISSYARMSCLQYRTYFFKSIFLGEKVTHFFYLHLMRCFCMNESKKWDQLTISFSIQKILLRPLQLLVEKNSLNKYFVWIQF